MRNLFSFSIHFESFFLWMNLVFWKSYFWSTYFEFFYGCTAVNFFFTWAWYILLTAYCLSRNWMYIKFKSNHLGGGKKYLGTLPSKNQSLNIDHKSIVNSDFYWPRPLVGPNHFVNCAFGVSFLSSTPIWLQNKHINIWSCMEQHSVSVASVCDVWIKSKEIPNQLTIMHNFYT